MNFRQLCHALWWVIIMPEPFNNFDSFRIVKPDSYLQEKERQDVELLVTQNKEREKPAFYWATKEKTLGIILLLTTLIYLTFLLSLGDYYLSGLWTGLINLLGGYLWLLIHLITG